jgi:hypothetical protein
MVPAGLDVYGVLRSREKIGIYVGYSYGLKNSNGNYNARTQEPFHACGALV